MDHLPPNNRGLTFIGFVLLAGIFGILMLLILKIAPIYIDHYKVKQSLASLKSDRDLVSRTKTEILASLEKHWDIDMIEDVTTDNVTVTKELNFVRIEILYDVDKPIYGNLDVLVHFKDSIEAGSR